MHLGGGLANNADFHVLVDALVIGPRAGPAASNHKTMATIRIMAISHLPVRIRTLSMLIQLSGEPSALTLMMDVMEQADSAGEMAVDCDSHLIRALASDPL